jgi:large subunit ribosomal protein L24
MGYKSHIKKDDQVVVLSGNFKGKKGKVLKVFPETGRVIVEGVNVRKKHTRPTQKSPQGGIVQKEVPIHASNVMLIEPKTGEPTRTGRAHVTDATSGKRRTVRVSRASGEMI